MAKRGMLAVFVMLMMLVMAGNVYAAKCGHDCGDCNSTCEVTAAKCGHDCGDCHSTCETRVEKEWTFLVFLNADNNLDSFGVKDVNEMEKIGSNDNVNIVVLLDRENGTAKKLYVTKDNDENTVGSKVIEEMGVYDMGNYKNLVSFVEWGVKNYPAKHYVVDIWNHGAGWQKRGAAMKGISYDDQSGNHITTPQLGEAMASIYKLLGKKLDILCMDACLMQMIEVTYEIKDYVQFCVASEETEPGDGYTYDDFLGPLAKNATMGALDLAKVMTQAYKNHYLGINQAGTQSSIDLAQMDAFVAKFDALCAKLAEKTSDKAFVTTLKKNVFAYGLQSFYYRTNKDLGHMLALLQTNVKDAEIQALVAEVIALYANGQNPLVSENGVTGATMKNATGLAIYVPNSVPGADYAALKFGKSAWMTFLKKYIPAAAQVQ